MLKSFKDVELNKYNVDITANAKNQKNEYNYNIKIKPKTDCNIRASFNKTIEIPLILQEEGITLDFNSLKDLTTILLAHYSQYLYDNFIKTGFNKIPKTTWEEEPAKFYFEFEKEEIINNQAIIFFNIKSTKNHKEYMKLELDRSDIAILVNIFKEYVNLLKNSPFLKLEYYKANASTIKAHHENPKTKVDINAITFTAKKRQTLAISRTIFSLKDFTTLGDVIYKICYFNKQKNYSRLTNIEFEDKRIAISSTMTLLETLPFSMRSTNNIYKYCKNEYIYIFIKEGSKKDESILEIPLTPNNVAVLYLLTGTCPR